MVTQVKCLLGLFACSLLPNHWPLFNYHILCFTFVEQGCSGETQQLLIQNSRGLLAHAHVCEMSSHRRSTPLFSSVTFSMRVGLEVGLWKVCNLFLSWDSQSLQFQKFVKALQNPLVLIVSTSQMKIALPCKIAVLWRVLSLQSKAEGIDYAEEVLKVPIKIEWNCFESTKEVTLSKNIFSAKNYLKREHWVFSSTDCVFQSLQLGGSVLPSPAGWFSAYMVEKMREVRWILILCSSSCVRSGLKRIPEGVEELLP